MIESSIQFTPNTSRIKSPQAVPYDVCRVYIYIEDVLRQMCTQEKSTNTSNLWFINKKGEIYTVSYLLALKHLLWIELTYLLYVSQAIAMCEVVLPEKLVLAQHRVKVLGGLDLAIYQALVHRAHTVFCVLAVTL
jgi:hypothetical protein